MYIVHVVDSNGAYNPAHKVIDGCKASISMLAEGKRGLFDFTDRDGNRHGVSTSKIIKIEEVGEDLKVKTMHTNYFFEKI